MSDQFAKMQDILNLMSNKLDERMARMDQFKEPCKEKILEEYRDHILTPDDVDHVDLSSLALGFSYWIEDKLAGHISEYKYTHKEGELLHFEEENIDDGAAEETHKSFQLDKKGRLVNAVPNDSLEFMRCYTPNDCRFLLGEAAFETTIVGVDEYRTHKSLTKYENGVWRQELFKGGVRNSTEPMDPISEELKPIGTYEYIFDKNGLLLYQYDDVRSICNLRVRVKPGFSL